MLGCFAIAITKPYVSHDLPLPTGILMSSRQREYRNF